jgi:hypothetical protein
MLLGGEGYDISRSVRLRSSATAYFNRTPASAGNRNTWTWSAWVKRGALGSAQTIFAGYPSSSVYAYIGFTSSDQIRYASTNSGASLTTTAVYRDPSAWYHIVFVYDDTQATSSNRLKLYVNGQQVTAFGTASYPTLNFGDYINSANVHNLGRFPSGVEYVDGYLTEVNFIDGQALTPSSFGETDSITGVWKAKKYAGTYGTNGFYLNFSDNSNNTAATIGKDSSGNGNNWTPNNISVTSGATYDSMLDVPTMWADGGNGRGNYCTINPLASVGVTPSNANLTVATAVSGTSYALGTVGIPTSGKWYWEYIGTSNGNEAFCGVMTSSTSLILAYYGSTGIKWVNGASSSYGATYTTNDVIGVAVDVGAGTVTFYKNNTSQGAITYSVTADTFFPYFADGSSSAATTFQVNFGQQPFTYTPPTGFKALNTQNLPDATIKKGNAYFDATTYTGNASTNNIVNSGAMQPDLVWIKNRGAAFAHYLTDAVRGAYKVINSNLTNAEYDGTSASDGVAAFNSDGFRVLGGTNRDNYNQSSNSYVAWQWKESVSAGFDIVTYTGTGSATTIAHSLGVAPKMMIVKSRSSAGRNWIVYHTSLGATQGIQLNLTGAASTVAGFWNNTAPTSSVFTVGGSPSSGYDDVNLSAATYVAYLFAEVAGYSKFGSYTGNGVANGPFVYLGFRPRYVMLKVTSNGSYWWMIKDSSRDTYNASIKELYANVSDAEYTTSGYDIDFVSNGFKIRSNGNALNGSGDTFIYAAFAENPFKNSLAR